MWHVWGCIAKYNMWMMYCAFGLSLLHVICVVRKHIHVPLVFGICSYNSVDTLMYRQYHTHTHTHIQVFDPDSVKEELKNGTPEGGGCCLPEGLCRKGQVGSR